MKTLYFDCFAGASGDMILGALVGLGINEKKIYDEIAKLNISNFKLNFEKVDRSGINAVKANIEIPDEHAHRHLHTIEKIIVGSTLSENVKKRAVKIFTKLAEAEAKVHGTDVQKVHFHEVGAMDAIIDVVGACIGFELLEIERFICSKIHVGSGFVKMAHGNFPVPPPAVAELLKEIPIYSTEIEGELITPTGAAIISTVCEDYGAIPKMKTEKTSYGAGGRNYQDFPNVLRLFLGETEVQGSESKAQISDTKKLILLETNLDDLPPQIFGFVMERAFEIGALDCWFTPIQMKKNRPATQISILCELRDKEKFLELLYLETTTLGVRITEVERNCLPREILKLETEFGSIDVKIARFGEKISNVKPEYDQIRRMAEATGKSLREVDKIVAAEIRRQIN